MPTLYLQDVIFTKIMVSALYILHNRLLSKNKIYFNQKKKEGERKIMAITKAQMKATKKYQDKTYDRIYLNVKKGKKDELKNIAKKQDKSLNEFINDSIDYYIKKEILK